MNERARPSPPVALYAGVAFAVVLVAFYLRLIIPYMGFGADLFMWGETDFVGNIIRLRGGHPMYSPVADINSSTYPPVAAMVTYWVTRLLGLPVEVPVLRYVQLGYLAAAAGVGLACWGALRALLFPGARLDRPLAWAAFTLLALFLALTAPETGQWVHALHTDALSLLWSGVSFLALLLYLARPTRTRFLLLAAAPAVGFAIKQYLLIWAPVAFFTLLIDDPRAIRRLAGLFLLTTALTFLVVLLGYLAWGSDYVFWVFEVVGGERSRIGFSAGGYEMSVPRAGDHLLRAWAPLSLGFVGGWMLLHRAPGRRATALWAPWLVLLAGEAMTSGTGWGALYHFGPGVMVGMVWLLAALPEAWPERGGDLPAPVRSAWSFTALVGMFLALGVVPSGDASQQRYWQRSVPEGAGAYVAAIEAEFDGLDPADVLMDWGNWVYLRSDHLARDRAISMWDFPTVGRYDLLEPMLERIRTRTYEKIIVHRYHARGFDYDWGNLERPTGVRAALQEHYDEVRVIPGMEGVQFGPEIMFGGPVYVLLPKDRDSAGATGAAR